MKQTNAKTILQQLEPLQPFEVKSTPQNMYYKVDINDDFEHPKQFSEIVDALDSASEGDYMQISLTTSGGALHSILPLLGAIENTPCHVHVHACSDVASAGTFLLMKAHSISMNDYVTVMCHQVSFGSFGSGNTVATHVSHTMKSSEKLIRDMYHGFFSAEDLNRMLTGTDFYMDKDEFVARYDARTKFLEEEYEAHLAAEQAALELPTKPKKPLTIGKQLAVQGPTK